MTATRSISRKTWALLTALMLFAALVVPVLAAQQAKAADGDLRMNIAEEVDSNPTGFTHTLTATVTSQTGNTVVGGAEVDFEVESGPVVSVNCTLQPNDTCTGGTASDADNSPTSPDITCTTAPDGTCTVLFTSATAGTNVVRGWVDDDKNNATFDADAAEGRDEATVPGDRTEPDDTDVVSKTWFATLPGNASLDCTPETATNPATGAGNVETYTCTLFNDNGAGSGTASNDVKDGTEAGIAGVLIDGENRNGANDPDDNLTGTSADYNDVGTTNASGQVTFNIGASEAQAGAANLCFWADADADTQVNGENSQIDGSGCSEAANEAGTPSDVTDVVTKTWMAVGVAATVTLTPASDQNLHSTSHTVTATVTDFFGTPVAGALVDFNVSGHNAKSQEQSLTNVSGQATFTYTDTAGAHTGNPDTDNIVACIDNNNNNNAAGGCTDDGGTAGGSATKYWFVAIPVAATTVIDMDGTGGPGGGADCTDDAVATPNNAGGAAHLICGDVNSAAPASIPGATATFTTNLGNFTNVGGTTDLGQSVTTTTDGNGEAFVYIESTKSGTATVTLTSGSATDSGTKEFVAIDARNIDCTPATAVNRTGTQHMVTCTVTDRFGNPTSGIAVFGTEAGTGRFESSPQTGSDVNGEVEFILSTVAGEEGEQTLTAEIQENANGTGTDTSRGGGPADDECEAPAGSPAGITTAGNCEDTVAKIWSDVVPPPVETDHARTLHLNRFKHIFLGGGRRALKVSGTLSTDDGFDACSANQPIKVQIRAGGEWLTRKSDTTNLNGKFKVLIRDIARKYRAVAPRTQFVNDDNTIDNCLRAVSNVRRHRH